MLSRSIALVLLFCPAACVTVESEPAKPIDPKTLEFHSARLLRPFKQGHVVLCRTLDIELNASFERLVTYPAGGARSSGDGYDQVAWSKDDRIKIKAPKNAAAAPRPIAEPRAQKFRVFIGSTTFEVDDRVRVRKLLKAPPTLTVTAGGPVLVIQNDEKADMFATVRYAEGQVQTKSK